MKRRTGSAGWLTLKPIESEAVPRIGEEVFFSSFDWLMESGLHQGPSYGQRVTNVEHSIEESGTDIIVSIDVDVPDKKWLDNFPDLAKKHGLRWLAKSE